MSLRSRIFGIGVNDSDYITSPVINGKQIPCPIYNCWKAMLTRCYSKKDRDRRSAYAGCEVHESWHIFSSFRGWYLDNYENGLSLDKDILVFENKVYSPYSCAYVPRFLNNLFRSSPSGLHGNGLPMGVSAPEKMKESPRPYMSCIKTRNSNSKHLGHFETSHEAHKAWQVEKIEAIKLAGIEYSMIPGHRKDVLDAIYSRAERIEMAISSGEVTLTV